MLLASWRFAEVRSSLPSPHVDRDTVCDVDLFIMATKLVSDRVEFARAQQDFRGLS